MSQTGPTVQCPVTVRELLVDYARGAAGGLLVGLPLMLTMEMWWHGFTMPPLRILLLLMLNYGVLLILERYSGFREEYSFWEEAEDALIAMGIGLLISAAFLGLLAQLGPGMSIRELVGKIALQSIPVSIGASVAISQLGQESETGEKKRDEAGFWGQKGIVIGGALFFGLNVAVTEEPMMLGLQMSPWHTFGLLLVSVLIVYAFRYGVEFRGSTGLGGGIAWWRPLVKESTVEYALCLAIAAFLLWAFGRFEPGIGLVAAIQMSVALGLMTSVGGAAANLIL